MSNHLAWGGWRIPRVTLAEPSYPEELGKFMAGLVHALMLKMQSTWVTH